MTAPGEPGEFIVTGTPTGGGYYNVKTKWVRGVLPAKSRRISASALQRWLADHGCEFSSHQVRMSKDFTCDHIERPRDALRDLELLAKF